MRILQVNKFYYRRGGADHHFLDLCDLLEKHGEAVIPFSMLDERNEPTPYSDYFVSNIELGHVGLSNIFRAGRVLYSFEAKRKITRLIADVEPEIAHLHLIYHHLSPSILPPLKKAGVPVVMTIHDWKAICPNYSLFTEGKPCVRCRGGHYWQSTRHLCMRHSLLRSAMSTVEAYFHHFRRYYEDYIDLLIAPIDFVKEMFVFFGWPENKIVVLPHFLAEDFIRLKKPTSPPVRPRFIYAGRLAPEKGIEQLVETWLKEKIAGGLDIFGEGPLGEKIRSMVAAGGRKDIVCHGAIGRDELAKRLPNYTAMIMPSVWYEIFGLAAIEAFARGVPVVASQRGSLVELVETSKAGVLFEWEKGPDSLPRALERLYANLEGYRQRAIDYMEGHHQAEEYYAALKNIYFKLAAGGK